MKWSIKLKNSVQLLKSNQDGTSKQIDIEKFKLALSEVDTKVKSLSPVAQLLNKIIPAWLSYFSIEGDHIEAKVVHELLCSMVER
ncbi:NAD(P)H dehydrogenase B4 [Tanacetum coccineum]